MVGKLALMACLFCLYWTHEHIHASAGAAVTEVLLMAYDSLEQIDFCAVGKGKKRKVGSGGDN